MHGPWAYYWINKWMNEYWPCALIHYCQVDNRFTQFRSPDGVTWAKDASRCQFLVFYVVAVRWSMGCGQSTGVQETCRWQFGDWYATRESSWDVGRQSGAVATSRCCRRQPRWAGTCRSPVSSCASDAASRQRCRRPWSTVDGSDHPRGREAAVAEVSSLELRRPRDHLDVAWPVLQGLPPSWREEYSCKYVVDDDHHHHHSYQQYHCQTSDENSEQK